MTDQSSIFSVAKESIPKKAAIIGDLTGFGRCSLTVALPIINAMQVQACPVPTSIFSNHMGFPSYYYCDLTDSLASYLDGYEALGLHFDGIYCGFLNALGQFRHIQHFLECQRSLGTPLILIDPVMGDKGKTYRIVTEEHCREMKKLVSYATILTPNLTEACLLTDTLFPPQTPDLGFLHTLAEKLLSLGPSQIAITGITHAHHVMNYCAEKKAGGICHFSCETPFNGESRPGTGDIFASILTADSVNGVPFRRSVQRAANFIRLCADASARAGVPIREGAIFEKYLHRLCAETINI